MTFHRGSSLKPMPPEASKHEQVRYVHIYEDEGLDEKQMKDWIKQAASKPGDELF
ncbi:hypothetical protein [Novilysobacter erysipheiresistens]|uniref:DUF5655 domain-containing protein n=1 Tax=Novilysobacter erysipheiresistens TaxID=1749332 RepID=A0ABU7YU43_9GAMM